MQDQFVAHANIVAFADERVNLKKDDLDTYRAQANRLREKLEKYIAEHDGFDLVKMLNSGSVAKGTALRTINDLDLAVYVMAGRAPQDEASLLDWTADRLREAYGDILSRDQIKPGDHAVTVEFRGSGLKIDVVPVLYEGKPDDRGQLIPKSTGVRVETSIRLHIDFTRARKKKHKTHYRQMVRLVKWWARGQKQQRDDFRFKSFMAELIVAHLFDRGLEGSNYPEALFQFFAYIVRTQLKERIAFNDYYSASAVEGDGNPIQVFDPVNPKNNVAVRYTEDGRRLIVEAAEEALDAIAMARRATTKGDAVAAWQEVLGTAFKG